jgi:DNA invertase Pin-like site-specific DNA recombinase
MSARCLIYCRVSDPGATYDYGMDAQERECREYSEAHDWEVTHVYQDWHTGTELFERPEINRMLADVRAGAVDVLLVHRLDRLSRESTHQNVIMYEVERAGVRWDSATEDVTGPNGVIMRAVLGAMAELDRSKIVEGMARGKREKVAAGRPLGQGKASYGLRFRRDESGRHIGWEEDPETVENVRRIFRDYDSGMSLRALGRALEVDGILPPYHERTGSTKWHLEQLRTDDPTAHDLEMIEGQRAELEKRQKKFVSVIAMLEDEDSAAPIAAELDRIGKALKANASARDDLLARRDAWQREQSASADVLQACKRIAADMRRVTEWSDRRAIAQALRVRFELYAADHEPRWIVTSQIVPEVTRSPGLYGTSECIGGT